MFHAAPVSGKVRVWPVLVSVPVKLTVPLVVVSVPSSEVVNVLLRLMVPDVSLTVPVFCHAPFSVIVPLLAAAMPPPLFCRLVIV
jgi:hypothetical protein